MPSTDIFFANTNIPTRAFYDQKHPFFQNKEKGAGWWVWELCRCCGARMAYSIDEFNNPAEYQCTGWNHHESLAKYVNVGITVMLNPDKDRVLPIEGTVVDYVTLGDDVLGLRLKPVV